MKVVSYTGEEPKTFPPPSNDKMLDVMLAQLRVLQAMATQVVIIPAGTKLSGDVNE